MTASVKNIKIINKGIVDYDSALRMQLEEKNSVKNGKGRGSIFFMEHDPPVITLGRRASAASLLFPGEYMKQRGYSVCKTGRAGDITVHEPGQLVVYFVLPVESKKSGMFVRNIMEITGKCIRENYGINALYEEKRPGLWVMEKKICSSGFDMTGGVSMHGIAINVSNSMEGFSLIIPCGMQGVEMTSLSIESGRNITVNEVRKSLSSCYRKEISGL